MASLDFLLQGMRMGSDHWDAITNVFSLPNIQEGIIASAFMNASGANAISTLIEPFGNQIKVYIGVRNGVTTMQAIQILLEHSIHPILVDTATQSFIFHPKVFLSCNAECGKLLIGSANATSGGLVKNIEASLCVNLDLSDENDFSLVNRIKEEFSLLEIHFPENVFQATNDTDLRSLIEQGLLVNEESTTYHAIARSANRTRTDNRPRMILQTRSLPRLQRATPETNTVVDATPPRQSDPFEIPNEQLLWKSGGLKRRDLCIPTAQGTNQTGSMLLKKGDSTQNINPRSYFRHSAFSSQDWAPDPRPERSHLERCRCSFRVIIKGIDYGVFTLLLSHNSRTDTTSYQQNNSMTSIHWGPELKPLIAREDLLGCILRIYDAHDGIYTLVFDHE